MSATSLHRTVPFGLLPLMLFSAIAVGDDGINLKITNDGTVDIFVTVYDANTHLPVAEHQRVNGFSATPVSASADASGLANISWTAIGVDDSDPHCGHGAASGLHADAVVNVHAGSDCPGR